MLPLKDYPQLIAPWKIANVQKVLIFRLLQSGKKLMAKLLKMALYLTPQAMYNQFKRQSAGSVSELYYIYRKT